MAELTSSTREAARRLGVSDTTMHKAERTGRITREPDGQWNIAKTRARLLETSDPQRSALAGSAAAEGTPFARLKVAQLALKVEAQRLALDESKGRLPLASRGFRLVERVRGGRQERTKPIRPFTEAMQKPFNTQMTSQTKTAKLKPA